MRVNFNDLTAIQQLQVGQFAYPDIPFVHGPLSRTSTTLIAAYSTIINCGLGNYLEDLAPAWKPNGNIIWQNKMVQTINDSLIQMIDMYRLTPDDDLLVKIFIRIQLWGGNTGRGVFTRGQGFQGNFDIDSYREAVTMVNINNNEALRSLLLMAQVGLSFATKHLFFWGENLPILDERISMLLYGKTLLPPGERRKVELYNSYISDLDAVANNTPGVTRLVVERALFNWLDTPHGRQWYNIRQANA
ncbi:hypothetical protein [Telluribacter sp.]|jgi:hypothetical protein|uniref:8-oxoguanine DNA glycosylase OGG fold protein n=1 Tax=Telluribacter sp. TaxID=1978767 RepID=UPI002E0D18EC|nr:hypothetical protein [Telluribacter sp.]